MTKTRKISVSWCGCKGCEVCSEAAPEYIGWDADNERPILLNEDVPEDVAQMLISYCPKDCIEHEDEE